MNISKKVVVSNNGVVKNGKGSSSEKLRGVAKIIVEVSNLHTHDKGMAIS